MGASVLRGISAAATRRPLAATAIVVALALAGGWEALGLRPSAGIDTFVGSSSPSWRATAEQQRRFGSDPVIVLVSEPLSKLLEPARLSVLARLEACLAGQHLQLDAALGALLPAAHGPYGGWGSPCGGLMRARAAKVVYGPGTFLNRAVAAVNAEIRSLVAGSAAAVRTAQRTAYSLAIARGMSPARAAREAAAAAAVERGRQLAALERVAASSGLRAAPSIDDEAFIRELALDAAGAPRPQLAYLFPSGGSALIQVRLRASLSDPQRARAIALIRAAVLMGAFRLAGGGTYTVTGVPVVLNDLASEITGSIAGLLAAALVAMALALLVMFRSRPALRVLPLAVALAAVGITFGLLALAGAGLTLASIAVLPILIGLAVDYGVQLQARIEEERRRAAASPAAGQRAAPAIAAAVQRAAPTIAVAAVATATGFAVLLLSPVPMVQGFGLLLVVGIAVAFACALVGVPATVGLSEGDGPLRAWLRGARKLVAPVAGRVSQVAGPSVRGARELVGPSVRGAGELVGPSVRGAGELVGSRVRGARRAAHSERLLAGVLAHPGPVLAAGVALAVLGWAVSARTPVQSDVTRLVPAGMPALRNLRELERVTGVSGEIDVSVRAADVATPATVRWMIAYEGEVLNHFGYHPQHGCARATLCPALSLPDLFTGAAPTRARIDGLLAAVPRYFTQAVITPDRRAATLAFGIRLMGLGRQQRVIGWMRSRLHPPPGVRAQLAGLPVLAAQANAALSSAGRRALMLIAALLAVGVALAVALRSPERALVPMAPILLATGWSALILWLVGIPLNPLSATLGTLVIAISTEFSVLLSERNRQERAAGHEPRVALARTYRSTGAAVLTSGVTAIAGFGVLVLSDITMLRDFGLVTLIDLSVSLGGVLLVLPAVLAVADRRVAPPRTARADAAAVGVADAPLPGRAGMA